MDVDPLDTEDKGAEGSFGACTRSCRDLRFCGTSKAELTPAKSKKRLVAADTAFSVIARWLEG